jgi:quinoprotein glucose dehydrogenase
VGTYPAKCPKFDLRIPHPTTASGESAYPPMCFQCSRDVRDTFISHHWVVDSLRSICGGVLAIAITLAGGAVRGQGTNPAADDGGEAPKLAPASSEAEDLISSFRKPEGWSIRVFAAEPEVANPVAFWIDNDGRVIVAETYRQGFGVTDNRGHDDAWLQADLAARTVADRIAYHQRLLGDKLGEYTSRVDRLRLLRDTDNDGKADSSTIFSSGYHALEDGTGAGVLMRGKDVYYTCIPKLYRLVDQNGDGQADEKVAMHDGFGVRVAFRGHDMHGLLLGPDGRLYFSIGDRGYHLTTTDTVKPDPASGAVFRCELDGSNLEAIHVGLRNPQELAFDATGQLFTWDNNSDSGDRARWVQLIAGGDSGWRMYYQYLADRGPFNREKIWHPFHREQPACYVPPIDNLGDGPSGIAFNPGLALGPQWKDYFFLVDFRGGASNSGIRAIKLARKGAFYTIADSQEPIWNILGTDIGFQPDGSILISDWVNGWYGENKGRLYHFASQSNDPALAKLLGSDWTAMATNDLLPLLRASDQRVRNEASFELARRQAWPELWGVATSESDDEIGRLHALWGLSQSLRRGGGIDEITKLSKLSSESASMLVRQWALTIATESKLSADDALSLRRTMLAKAIGDAEPTVRVAALLGLSKHSQAGTHEAIIKQLEANNDEDPILRHAAIEALARVAKDQPTIVRALSDHASVAVRRGAVVALRRAMDSEVARFLRDADPLVSTEAARAIHDTPMPAAIGALAGLIEELPSGDDALIRRVLNANFRLGTEQAALGLATFATSSQGTSEHRREAIEMLADWQRQDGRDRVLNDWRPLQPEGQPPRSAEPAVAAIRSQLTALAANPDVGGRTLSIASTMGIKDASGLLRDRYMAVDGSASDRAEALLGLARLDQADAVSLAQQVLSSDPVSIQAAALSLIADQPSAEIDQRLSDATGNGEPLLRQLAWDLLGKRHTTLADATLASGVESYLAGNLPSDCWLNVIEAATSRIPDDLQQRLDQQQQQWTQSDPLSAYRDASDGGDVARGESLFYTRSDLSCVRCHRAGARGGDVGPNLAGLAAQKDRRYMLESIVLPDAAIAKGFESVRVLDDLGNITNGVFKSETDDFLDLVSAEGTAIRIDKESIVERFRGNSAMPADLHKMITRRELRDLVAFLSSLTTPPETAPSAADDE